MQRVAVITQIWASRHPRGSKRRHAQPIDLAGCFGWIIERDHGEVIATMALGPVLRAGMRVERPDVPRADAEDVLHCGTVARIMPLNPIAILQSNETQWRPLPWHQRRPAHAGVLSRDHRQADHPIQRRP